MILMKRYVLWIRLLFIGMTHEIKILIPFIFREKNVFRETNLKKNE